jgi:hypothetical protein
MYTIGRWHDTAGWTGEGGGSRSTTRTRRLYPQQYDRYRDRYDVVSDGEWRTSRIIYAQFHNVSGNDIGQFKDMSRQIVVWPPGPALSSIPMAKRAGEPTGLKRGRENESSLG